MSAAPQVPDESLGPARPQDAVRASWIDRASPRVQPYLRLMRLDRPIGYWLLYWPCVFGLALGAAVEGARVPDPFHLALTFAGAVIMRGAGSTYNDIVDRDYDAKVARTRARPIPSGAVSVKRAWAFAAAQALLGLAILLSFDRFAILVGASSLLLVAAYPFMKRITFWPQAWLGLTFNWGVPFGYAAATGTISGAALLFYAGCFFWTLGYDTIYAHQDKEDDALIGVKSSALRLGARTRPWLGVFYGLALALMVSGGLAAGLGAVFALVMLFPAAHFLWQLRILDIDDPRTCLKLFRANHYTGALIAAALLLGCVTKA